jgi:hypothetical protein
MKPDPLFFAVMPVVTTYVLAFLTGLFALAWLQERTFSTWLCPATITAVFVLAFGFSDLCDRMQATTAANQATAVIAVTLAAAILGAFASFRIYERFDTAWLRSAVRITLCIVITFAVPFCLALL